MAESGNGNAQRALSNWMNHFDCRRHYNLSLSLSLSLSHSTCACLALLPLIPSTTTWAVQLPGNAGNNYNVFRVVCRTHAPSRSLSRIHSPRERERQSTAADTEGRRGGCRVQGADSQAQGEGDMARISPCTVRLYILIKIKLSPQGRAAGKQAKPTECPSQ